MRNRSEIFNKFVHLVKFAEKLVGNSIKMLRSGSNGEYKSA